MLLLDLQLPIPDQYFWYTLAGGLIWVVSKMWSYGFGKMDKQLDKFENLLDMLTENVNDLKTTNAVYRKEIETIKADVVRLEDTLKMTRS